jgi:hypothetical protein
VGAVSTVTEEQIIDLLSLSATFTIVEDAVQNLAQMTFDDEEIAVFDVLPETLRMKITLRLVDLAEQLREILRELDGRVLQLTAERQEG